MLWLFSAVRLLLYVCQVISSTVYNWCRCCFVSLNPCARGSVKFLSLFGSLQQVRWEAVRTVTLPGWACTWTSHALSREAWPRTVSSFPVIWQKWGTSSLPNMSQEFGPSRSLCAIPKYMYFKPTNAVRCCCGGCRSYFIWPLFLKFHLCGVEWTWASLCLWVNELWASASGKQPGCLHD